MKFKLKLKKNMMNTRLSVILIIILFFTFTSFINQTNTSDKIIGVWLLPDNLEIEIFKIKGKYFGKITEVYGFKDGLEKDIYNPDKARRNDELIGKIIISDLQYDHETKQWINGTIYAPQKGLTLNLTIMNINGNTLEAKGSKLFLSKKIFWKRIQ